MRSSDLLYNLPHGNMIGAMPLRDLPNIHGYEFIGVRWDGSSEPCRIIKCDDGLHRIAGDKYKDLKAWREVKK